MLGLGLWVGDGPDVSSAAVGPLAAFAPNRYALWLPSPAYCFTDAAGTVPCGTGDAIRVWKDADGFGRNMTQAAAGNRPTLVSLGGGKWVARGTTAAVTGMTGPLFTGGGTQRVTLACKSTAETTTTRYVQALSIQALLSPKRATAAFYIGSTAVMHAWVSDSLPHVSVAEHVPPAGWTLKLDGATVTVDNNTATDDWPELNVGGAGFGAESFDGDIYGIGAHVRTLSGGEAAQDLSAFTALYA